MNRSLIKNFKEIKYEPINKKYFNHNLQNDFHLIDGHIDKSELEEHEGISLRLDLSERDLVGWRARQHTGVINIERTNYYEPEDFWEPVAARNGSVILNPDDFYILAT